MGLISVSANTNFSLKEKLRSGFRNSKMASCWMYVVWRNPQRWCLCACQCGCVCELVLLWCHRAVAGPLCRPELCEAASPSPSLSGPALRALPRTGAPRPICRVLLIVDHNAVTPRPFSTTGKLIVLLPSHSRPVIQPMREQHWGGGGGFLLASPPKASAKENTHLHT